MEARLSVHVLALLAVVIGCILLTSPGVAYFSDEGVVMVQARLLERGDDWYFEPTFPALDPGHESRPFQNGDFGTNGLAPYAKHPIYPLLIAVGGASTGFALSLSVAGLIAASSLAALIARQLGAGRAASHVTLWVVGLSSPLLFAAGLVVAHTLAAATAALAAWAALQALSGRQSSGLARVGLLATITVACFATALLRTEGAFLGPALALGALLVAAGAAWPQRLLVGALTIAASAAGVSLDRVWARSIVGTPLPAPSSNRPPETGSWLTDRWSGLYTTVLAPGYRTAVVAWLVWWVALVVIAWSTVQWRRRRLSDRAFAGALLIGVALYGLNIMGRDEPLPGIVIAFPLLWVGALLAGRLLVADPRARVLAISIGASLAAIALTQYSDGGGWEWGWRYAAYTVPLAVPLVVAGCERRLEERPVPGRSSHWLTAIAVVWSLCLTVTMVLVQRQTHRTTAELSDAIAEVASATPEGDQPVVLGWNRFLPQILYQDFFDYRWVVPDRAVLADFAARLADAGTPTVILVGPGAREVGEELPGWRPVKTVQSPGGSQVVAMESEP